MWIILASLILLIGLFTIGRKYSTRIFCPLCFAVSTAWIIGLFLYFTSRWSDPIVLSILMGSSLGAAVTLFGKKWDSVMKSVVYLAGFPTIYFIIQKDLAKTAVSMIVLILAVVLAQVFKIPNQKYKDEFNDCCT